MVQLLYKYLIINKHVTLPGVGVFYIQRQPAKHDYANKLFTSPNFHIEFNASNELPDKRFYEFVSKERGLNEAEAAKNLHAFSNRLTEEVKANRTVELPGIGMLKINASGQLTFESTNILTTYFPPTVAETVLNEKSQSAVSIKNGTKTPKETILLNESLEEEEVKSKIYWWVYAIILALLGAGAIGYYYYINGSFK
jgi:nucleoid DNA-binding protein